jgi:hypothetical protein
MMQLWSGQGEVDTSFTKCESLWVCWRCTQDRTMEEMKDGACVEECKIFPAAVGPGSSTIAQRRAEAHRESYGTSFWSRYGLPIIIGIIVLVVALIASGFVILKRWRSASSDEERLLATPMRHVEMH